MGSYSAAVCGDGINVTNWEKLSAKSAGKSVDAWRKAVIDALRKAAAGDATTGKKATITATQAAEFHKVADALSGKTAGTSTWSSPDQLESLLDGKVPGLGGFAGNKSGYNQHKRPMWKYLKKKGLAYEADWQAETATSFVNKGGKRVYVDAAEVPYFVSDGSIPSGTFAKITAPNGKSIYARCMEVGPGLGEVSLAAWKGLGYPNVNPTGAPTSTLKIDVLNGSGGLSSSAEHSNLNYDEIQRAGKLVEQGKLSRVRTRNDLLRAEGKSLEDESDVAKPKPKASASKKSSKKSDSKSSGGGPKLKKGFKTVAVGPQFRRVGYASADCLHEAGGYVNEGSATVYVGTFPMSRVGDGTSDGYGIVTGAEAVFVGGATKSIA